MPAERELSAKFGVSRTVVREALASLTAKGLISGARTTGGVVVAADVDSVSRSLGLCMTLGQTGVTYDKVSEVRCLVEEEVAALAAIRRTEDDLNRLQTALNTVLDERHSREGFSAADVLFHRELASATHNPLFGIILDSLSSVLYDVRFTGFDVPETPERATLHHREIFEEVRDGDSEGARAAMRRHLVESEVTQLRVIAGAAQLGAEV